jgi:hypothetical protein
MAMQHGANSPRRVQPFADELRPHVLASAPWVRSPAFASAVESYCWLQAQVLLLRAFVNERGMLEDDEAERSATKQLDRLEGRLAKARHELGLSPQALSPLLRSAATVAAATGNEDALAALIAEGGAILEARSMDNHYIEGRARPFSRSPGRPKDSFTQPLDRYKGRGDSSVGSAEPPAGTTSADR